MNNVLGQRIKALREERGLTQKDLAKTLNIANTTLSQYESGQRIPSDEVKIKIAEYFRVTLDYLFGVSDNKEGYEYIDELRKRYKKKGKDISHLSYDEIDELLEKGLKVDEMFKKQVD